MVSTSCMKLGKLGKPGIKEALHCLLKTIDGAWIIATILCCWGWVHGVKESPSPPRHKLVCLVMAHEVDARTCRSSLSLMAY